MDFLKNKLKEKERKYQRRKFKTNIKSKLMDFDYRLLVNKTNLLTWMQVISKDGKVVLDINDKKLQGDNKTQKAENLGLEVAKFLKDKGIEKVVFDRNGFLYHGRVKAIAEGIRKGGIKL